MRSDMRGTNTKGTDQKTAGRGGAVKKTARRLSAGMLAFAVFMTMPGAGYCAAAENLVVSEDKAEAESEAKPVIVTEPKEASEPGTGEALGEDAKLKIEDESEEEPGRDAGDESEKEPGLKTTDVSGGDPKPVTTDVSGGDPDADIMLLAEDGLTQDSVASVTVGGQTEYYDRFIDAWEAAQGKTATVKVLQDVNMTGEPLVMEDPGGDITLDMAEGVTLLSEKYGNTNGEVIAVKSGNFTLAGGCVRFENKGSSHIEDGCAIRVNGGNVRIEGGLVKTYGSVSYAGKGPAVKVESGNFTIRGGKLEQTGYPASGLYVAGGEAAMEGGEIEGRYRGIYATGGRTVVKGGSITARSGAITGNNADEYGGAIYVGGGEVTVENGTIRETGEMYVFSYGVYVDSGSISVSGGEISGGRDGIYLGRNGGEIRISGGSFTGDSDYGLQANKDQNDSVTLSGGTFTGGDRAIVSALNKLMALPEEGYAYYTVENGEKELFLPSGNSISLFPKKTAVVDKCTHSYGDWKSGGDKTHTRTCAVCGMEEREACEYQYEDLSGGDGTGAGSGHAGVCSVCGGRLSQEDHVYGSWADIGNEQCARTCTLCGRRQTAGLTRPSGYIQKVYRNSAVTVLSAQVTDAKASYVWRRQGEEAVLSTVDSYQIPVDLVVGSYAYECAVTLEGDAEPVVTWICTVKITPDSVAGSTVEVNGGSPVYFDGKAKEPPLVVTKKGVTLQEGTDYTVEYTNNTAVGTAGYTLTGMGNYKETLKGSFAVVRYETDETAAAPAGWSNSAKIAAPDGYTISFDEKGTFAPYIIYDTQTGEEGTKVSYYLRQNDTGYITDAKKVTVKVDTTLPSISAGEEGIQITDRDTWWQKLLTAVSFGYYKPQQVTIQASDALSGIAGIFYYIENAGTPIDEEAGKPAMTAEELNALGDTEWKALSLDQAGSGQQTSSASGSFGLSAEGSYVIYAYAVDRAGNRSAYICSDGIVVDTTAPVLTLAAPAGEGLRDTSAAAKLQMNEPGTVTYILSETEKSGITAGQIKADADKREKSVTARQAGTDLELPFTGLKANTAYYVYAVGTDAAGNETQSVAEVQFTTLKTAIAGAVSFAGDAVYGETLRAAIEVAAAGHGTVSCRWYRVDDAGKETEISGAVSTEYRLTAEDIGCRIRVEVTAENCSGKLEAVTDKIEKAAAPAEHTPVNGRVNDESGTDTFIFTGKEGVCYEYSVDGGNTWTEMTQDAFSQDAQNPERVTGTVEIGNYAYKAGQIQVRAKETETYKAGAAIQNREAFTASLEGSVVLTGEAKYGETLRAETDGTQSGAVLTYSFYRSGVAAPVQTGSSAVYTLTANDIGKVISVRVTAADYTGGLTAEAPQAVEKADGKEIAAAVTGTSEHDMTVYTYTINPVAGAQYRMDDGDWQDSNVFADITPNTAHTFYARIAETDCYKAGAPKSTGEVTFPKLTPAAPALRYEVKEEADGARTVVIEKVEGAEYSFDGGLSWSSGEGANVKEGCGASDTVTVGIRLRGTGTHNPSGEVLQTVDLAKKQQGLPDAYALTYQANGEEDYTVRIPETEGCEYSFDGVTWSSDPIKEGVLPGEIVTGYKRYKETATYNAGGMVSAQVQLPKFTVKTPVISPAGGSYAGTVGVTITCASPGAEIYYTINGSTPDRSAKRYTGAFTVAVPAVVKAVAVKAGMKDSAVASVDYAERGNSAEENGGGSGGSNGSGSGSFGSGTDREAGDLGVGTEGDAAGAGVGEGGTSEGSAGGKNRGDSSGKSAENRDTTGGENGKLSFRKPFIKGENGKEGWDVIRDEEETAEEGSAIHVDMNGSVVVPGYIFDSIRGRNITVTFDMGEGILWSVNGKDIVTEKTADIDFSVKRDEGSIPVDIVNRVTGENYSIQIRLAYRGEFGFTAVLSIQLGSENAGYLANLYYYNEDTGKLEWICADEIGEDGTAELTFTHASDYVIVVEEAGEKTENAGGTEGKDDMEEKDGGERGDVSGLSGSGILLLIMAAVAAVAAGIWFILVRMRRKEEEQEHTE